MNSEARPVKQLDLNFSQLDQGIESISPADRSRRNQRWQLKLLRMFWEYRRRRFTAASIQADRRSAFWIIALAQLITISYLYTFCF